MSSFNVRIFAIRRRAGRRAFEVRWRVNGRDKSRCFITRALADSYHAELIRAARRGLEFDPATGEPAAWAAPEPVTVTWYQHAVAYTRMKWPHLAAHSRASLAEALATVTPLLIKETGHRPSARAARSPVRLCLQRATLLDTTGPGRRQRAYLAGTRVAADPAAKRPAHHPGRPRRPVRAAGRLARGGEHDHPQAGRIP
jgi:hypothetical protein